MGKKREKKYDKVMRENLGIPSRGLILRLLSLEIKEATILPPITRLAIVERETDTIVLVKAKGRKPFVLHIEFQSTNDPMIVKRMAVYDYMLHFQYGLEVVSVVIYTGAKPIRMQNSIRFNNNYYSFQLVDIRDIDSELFLSSSNPKELIFSILAGHDIKRREFVINELFAKLQRLTISESELRIRLKEIEILSGLRDEGIQQLIKRKFLDMPIVVDIRNTPFFKEGQALGEARGETKGIQKATKERNTAFVTYLLQHTNKSIEEIAAAINVSTEFVVEIKNRLKSV